MCPRGCDKDALSCGRGKAYFQAHENPMQDTSNVAQEPKQDATSHNHHEHGGHHGRKDSGRGHHHMAQFPKDSLESLLMQCGHHLFHAARKGEELNANEIVKGLSSSEQEELKALLSKLIASWND